MTALESPARRRSAIPAKRPITDEAPSSPRSVTASVLAALRAGSTEALIAADLGISVQVVRAAVRQLVALGLAQPVGGCAAGGGCPTSAGGCPAAPGAAAGPPAPLPLTCRGCPFAPASAVLRK
ncbi:hypothetical protein [Rarobacter incanus]|uniref:Uncharacterized protein n=1 Tax=Rarobacter incanus TaxID=153494 RepID=A0A542SQN8_9MICO|nr:hypothetical protein [Rarobacter incanus]TQK76922.1 hypothetical protein FB389_1624 [Rarobacter incanus]